eukprot:4779102-Pleurochrysis_carterae.AAC.3
MGEPLPSLTHRTTKNERGTRAGKSCASTANDDPSLSPSSNAIQKVVSTEKSDSEARPKSYRIRKGNIIVDIDTPQGIKAKSDTEASFLCLTRLC